MARQGQLRGGLGTALKALRAGAELSQEALADAADLHRTYVSQLERGLKSPSLDSLELLASALGCRPYELVLAAEEEAASSAGYRRGSGRPGLAVADSRQEPTAPTRPPSRVRRRP